MGTFPHIHRTPQSQLFRNGIIIQAAHSFSYSAYPRQGPLAPSCFQGFPATMGLSDSQLRQTSRLFIPGHPPALSPDRSGSPRFLDASFRARPPLPPRGTPQVHTPVASLRVAGFHLSGGLAAPTLRNEAESGSLALGLTRSRSAGATCFATRLRPDHRSASHAWLPSHRGPPLHGERAITMADTLQPARCTRLRLALPDYAD